MIFFSCEKPLVDPQLAAPEPALLSQANLQPEVDKTKLKKVKGKKKKKKKPKKVVGNHTIASKKSVHPGSSTKKVYENVVFFENFTKCRFNMRIGHIWTVYNF